MQKKKVKISRRSFLKGSLAVATIATAASRGKILGANDRIRLGVIGTGNRSSNLMKNVNKIGGIQWVALSDIWDRRMEEAAEITGASWLAAAVTVCTFAGAGLLVLESRKPHHAWQLANSSHCHQCDGDCN